jgi:hypothetical protein
MIWSTTWGVSVSGGMAKMIVFDQQILGMAILFLLGMLVTVKRAATGPILDKQKGSLLAQLVNIFNLFFLLVVNPLAAWNTKI